MRPILVLILFGITSLGFSQMEFNSKSKAFLPIKQLPKTKTPISPETSIPSIAKPNVFKSPYLNKSTPNSAFIIGKPSEISLIPKNDFANPGDIYRDKMTKDLNKTLHEGDAPLLRENMDFGQRKTKSKYLIIKYRDYIVVDGDLLRVYSNGLVIQNQLYLDANLNEFRINLAEGFNKLEFEALNTGTSGGNTAEIQVYDDANTLISDSYWNNLAAGFKGSLLIIKE